MPSTRPVRSLLVAAFAALFGLVSILHAGAHLGSRSATIAQVLPEGDGFDGSVGCALCQNAAAVQNTAVCLHASAAPAGRVPVLVALLVPAPERGGLSSRGPPALG